MFSEITSSIQNYYKFLEKALQKKRKFQLKTIIFTQKTLLDVEITLVENDPSCTRFTEVSASSHENIIIFISNENDSIAITNKMQ